MLIPYQKRQKDEEFDFDNVKRRRKTKDEQRRSKEQKKEKLIFKTKTCVREGATVAASPLTLQYGRPFVRRAVRQHSSMETFKPSAGKLH